jgi:hypothetical protein
VDLLSQIPSTYNAPTFKFIQTYQGRSLSTFPNF